MPKPFMSGLPTQVKRCCRCGPSWWVQKLGKPGQLLDCLGYTEVWCPGVTGIAAIFEVKLQHKILPV